MLLKEQIFKNYMKIYEQKNVKLSPPAPYILFCEFIRPEIKKTNPNITFGQAGKEMRNLWDKLTEEERNAFNDASLLIKNHIGKK